MIAGLCTLAVLLPLVLIFGYLVVKGVSSLNLDFFTQLPKPVGEPGGGMANAIVGSLTLVGLACVIGLPIGVLTGVYLAEHGPRPLGVDRPLLCRRAERRALDRHRHLRLHADRPAHEELLRLRRRLRARR